MLGQPLDETEAHVKVAYFGREGTGKTTAMAGLARKGQIVAVDIEGNGWIASSLRKRGIPTENVIKFNPTNFAEVEQVYFEIQGMFDDGLPVVGVAVDHMTELQRRLVRDASAERIDLAIRKGKTSEEFTDIYQTELNDYGKWTNQAYKLTRLFRDLPCHVAFGAHMDLGTGRKTAALTEKFRNDFLGTMNIVIGTDVSQRGDRLTYVGISRPVQNWSAKDRYDVLPVVLPNPSMDRIVDYVSGELTVDNDPEIKLFNELDS